MLTIMCPNCRHRFPAPGCCNPGPQGAPLTQDVQPNIINNRHENRNDNVISGDTDCPRNGAFYGGGYLLVPREYDAINNRGCFINAPTIIHGPAIIQGSPYFEKMPDRLTNDDSSWSSKSSNSNRGVIFNDNRDNSAKSNATDMNCQINTTCDLTGGTVTITTPSIQSGGCLIQSTDSGILVQAPRIEIRPKLSGGGCLVQKRYSTDDEGHFVYPETAMSDNFELSTAPPSGCQELPGTRGGGFVIKEANHHHLHHHHQQQQQQHHRQDAASVSKNNDFNVHHNVVSNTDNRSLNIHLNPQTSSDESQQTFGNDSASIDSSTNNRHSICCCVNKARQNIGNFEDSTSVNHRSSIGINEITKKSLQPEVSNGMEIRVNATVQLPPNVGHCTVNITATTGNTSNVDRIQTGRTRDHFNGGGLINFEGTTTDNGERREETPTTPVSWLMPCPWGFDNYNYPMDKDVTRLAEIKRSLLISGWYHEGLSWQQSENLLKNTQIGRWLMRDSSDSRFIFAVSVQTARGPTSVRVHYFCGKFRLDAEPRLSLAMPLFDCPIKMLEHYVDYSKIIDEHRKEVWVDYSGQLYSQIYLTKPLVKDVQTLSHLARVVVNSNKLPVNHLPPLMKNYLAEYSYSL